MNIESKNFVQDLEKLLRKHNVDMVLDCYVDSADLTFDGENISIGFHTTSSKTIDTEKIKNMYIEYFKDEKIMSEKETISGFDIEKRELTDEDIDNFLLLSLLI